MSWLYSASTFVLFVIMLIILPAAAMTGYRIGRHLHARDTDRIKHNLHGLDTALLGLLALLIGFTLAIALTRYEARREGVLAEANAIGTTWLRAQLLPEPYRGEITRLLQDYVRIRVGLMRRPATARNLAAAIAQSAEVQNAMWKQATALAAALPQPIPTGLFIQSLNDTIDMQQTRVTAATSHVPGQVFILLAVVATLASGFTAFSGGLSGNRVLFADLISSVLIVCILATVFDLDDPGHGFIQVSQQPILALAASMGVGSPP